MQKNQKTVYWFIAGLALALISNSVFAATPAQSAKNERILARFSTCKAANQSGYKNLKTRVGFHPAGARRQFDADKDGISCEVRR